MQCSASIVYSKHHLLFGHLVDYTRHSPSTRIHTVCQTWTGQCTEHYSAIPVDQTNESVTHHHYRSQNLPGGGYGQGSGGGLFGPPAAASHSTSLWVSQHHAERGSPSLSHWSAAASTRTHRERERESQRLWELSLRWKPDELFSIFLVLSHHIKGCGSVQSLNFILAYTVTTASSSKHNVIKVMCLRRLLYLYITAINSMLVNCLWIFALQNVQSNRHTITSITCFLFHSFLTTCVSKVGGFIPVVSRRANTHLLVNCRS